MKAVLEGDMGGGCFTRGGQGGLSEEVTWSNLEKEQQRGKSWGLGSRRLAQQEQRP